VKAGKTAGKANGKAMQKKVVVARKRGILTPKVSKLAKASKGSKASRPAKAPAPDQQVGRVVIRELDPQQKCGQGTSVQFLYRVDHTVDGRRTAHLVFFDPHGWYCEHGRTCPAVAHAKKHNGQFARVS
jgi:ribosomal protein S17